MLETALPVVPIVGNKCVYDLPRSYFIKWTPDWTSRFSYVTMGRFVSEQPLHGAGELAVQRLVCQFQLRQHEHDQQVQLVQCARCRST